jgi:hypothetical protein
VSVLRSGNADVQFTYAEDGDVATTFEVGSLDRRGRFDADRFVSAMGRVGLLGDGGRRRSGLGACLELVADVCGVAVDGGLLRAALPGVRVLPVLAAPAGLDTELAKARAVGDAVAAASLVPASDEQVTAVARTLTMEMMDSAGLTDDALPMDALAAGCPADGVGDESPLGRQARWLIADGAGALVRVPVSPRRSVGMSPQERELRLLRSSVARAVHAVVSLEPRAAVYTVLQERRRRPRQLAARWLDGLPAPSAGEIARQAALIGQSRPAGQVRQVQSARSRPDKAPPRHAGAERGGADPGGRRWA